LRVRWSAEARRDRRELIGYVEEESLRMALELDDRVSGAVMRLGDYPNSGRPGRVIGTRELVISRTPYIAVYTIDEAGVRIARLIHGAKQWPEEG
jgi:addiction module RelE/StbE family toxin